MVSIAHLSKSFGNNCVLKNFNLEVTAGENLVILGKSGSGKSVLIKCLVGLIKPDRGEVSLFDELVLHLKTDALNELRKKIGFLFQGAALYDSMTVSENLIFPLRSQSEYSDSMTQTLIKEVLQQVGLEDAIDKMPADLSGGMKKRVALARALMLQPALMLYDEPTTGLDPITSREISQLILDVQRNYKTTSIIITHDIACAKIVANRIIVINEGTIAAEGTFEQLANAENAFVKSFFV